MSCLATYFSKAGTPYSLEVATKSSFGGKKTPENLDF